MMHDLPSTSPRTRGLTGKFIAATAVAVWLGVVGAALTVKAIGALAPASAEAGCQ